MFVIFTVKGRDVKVFKFRPALNGVSGRDVSFSYFFKVCWLAMF